MKQILDNLKKKGIHLIVSDFDGVMTDNRVLVDENGKEAVWVNRSDGLGISMLRKEGIDLVILSTERNPVVSRRAEKLGVKCYQDISDKKDALLNIALTQDMSLDHIAYIGNDINDLEAMKVAGFKIAPADAYPAILETADIVTVAKGGYGVIREIAEEYLIR